MNSTRVDSGVSLIVFSTLASLGLCALVSVSLYLASLVSWGLPLLFFSPLALLLLDPFLWAIKLLVRFGNQSAIEGGER